MGRPLPMFEAPEICGPCGGACCKTLPGATSPDDWGAPDVDVMVALVLVGACGDETTINPAPLSAGWASATLSSSTCLADASDAVE